MTESELPQSDITPLAEESDVPMEASEPSPKGKPDEFAVPDPTLGI